MVGVHPAISGLPVQFQLHPPLLKPASPAAGGQRTSGATWQPGFCQTELCAPFLSDPGFISHLFLNFLR